MAEEQQQSKGIGELFVEFGAKGLPTLLKGLNSVSASFLLGKNAASQFVQMLAKPIKEAGAAAVEIGKLSNSLDVSRNTVAKLKNYLQSKNVSEGLVQDLGNIQTTVRDVLSGFSDLPGNFANAFAKTGHVLEDYSEDFEDILRLVKDIQNADLTRSERNQIFDFLGMSRDWGYLFERGDFNLEDALALPDDVIEQNIKAQENLQEFGIALKALSDLLVAELLPSLTGFVNWFTGLTKDIIGGKTDNVSKKIENNAGKIGAVVGIANPALGIQIAGAGNIAKMQRSIGGSTGNLPAPIVGGGQPDFGTAPWIKNKEKGSTTGGAAPIVPDFMAAPEMLTPSSMMNQTNYIEITNRNNISGTNAQAIADSIIAINENDINYSQFQLGNLPGI